MTRKTSAPNSPRPALSSQDKKLDDIKQLLEKNLGEINAKYENINTRIDTLQESLDKTLTDIRADITTTSTTATDAQTLANANETKIQEILVVNEQLKEDVYMLSAGLEKTNIQLDDQINRGLRNTLVIKGIPRENKNETWDDTTAILIEEISRKLPNLTKEWFENKIERAHRSTTTKNIIAKFVSWQDSELVKTSMISFNKNSKNKGNPAIIISQMFSPALTTRRNLALKERKDFIITNTTNDYILTYPANLLVREKGSKDQFKLYKEY